MGISVPLNKIIGSKTDIMTQTESTDELEIIENEDIVNTSDEENLIQENLETTVTNSDSVATANRLLLKI